MRGALAFLLSLIFLGLIFYKFKNIDTLQITQATQQLNWWYFLAAPFAFAAAVYLQAIRWVSLTPKAWGIVPHQAFASMYVGLWFNLLLPGRVGELARPYHLAQKCKRPFASVLATAVWDRLIDTAVVLAMLGYAISMMSIGQGKMGIWVTIGTFIAALVALLIIIYFKIKPSVWIERWLPAKLLEPLRQTEDNFYEGMLHRHTKATLAQALALSVGAWAFNVAGYVLLLQGFALPALLLGIKAAVVITFASAFAHVVPAAAGGIGVVNYAIIVSMEGILRANGVSAEPYTALFVAVSAVIYVAQLIPDILIGGYCYFIDRKLFINWLPGA